jgi:hypothetical protein
MKLKFALVGLVALGSLAAAGTASAMPAATANALGGSDGAVIQVKGGHGHGGGQTSRRSWPSLRLGPWPRPPLWLAASSPLVVIYGLRPFRGGRLGWRPPHVGNWACTIRIRSRDPLLCLKTRYDVHKHRACETV